MTADEVRIRLRQAMEDAGFSPETLSISVRREGQFLTKFFNGALKELGEESERKLEERLSLPPGSLHITDEWTPREKAEFRIQMEGKVFHWTPKGTFKIIAHNDAAGTWYVLWWRDEALREYLSFDEAAQSISGGEHDKTFGFSGASLNVPLAVVDWNGFP